MPEKEEDKIKGQYEGLAANPPADAARQVSGSSSVTDGTNVQTFDTTDTTTRKGSTTTTRRKQSVGQYGNVIPVKDYEPNQVEAVTQEKLANDSIWKGLMTNIDNRKRELQQRYQNQAKREALRSKIQAWSNFAQNLGNLAGGFIGGGGNLTTSVAPQTAQDRSGIQKSFDAYDKLISDYNSIGQDPEILWLKGQQAQRENTLQNLENINTQQGNQAKMYNHTNNTIETVETKNDITDTHKKEGDITTKQDQKNLSFQDVYKILAGGDGATGGIKKDFMTIGAGAGLTPDKQLAISEDQAIKMATDILLGGNSGRSNILSRDGKNYANIASIVNGLNKDLLSAMTKILTGELEPNSNTIREFVSAVDALDKEGLYLKYFMGQQPGQQGSLFESSADTSGTEEANTNTDW